MILMSVQTTLTKRHGLLRSKDILRPNHTTSIMPTQIVVIRLQPLRNFFAYHFIGVKLRPLLIYSC
jgi:hypothetical protein